jgi:hypothetical protein
MEEASDINNSGRIASMYVTARDRHLLCPRLGVLRSRPHGEGHSQVFGSQESSNTEVSRRAPESPALGERQTIFGAEND